MFRLFASRTTYAIRARSKPFPQTIRHHVPITTPLAKPYSQSTRFYKAEKTYRYFRNNPRMLALLLGSGGVFYVVNLEQVPGSGRRRFNWVPATLEIQLSEYLLDSVLQEYKGKILLDDTPEVRLVQKVIDRLLPHTGVQDQGRWEVRVIDDPTTNAFVIPGNKVFVFTGMFNITQNEDGLAAVLGHEIAHNVAHHTGENISRSTLVLPLALLFTLLLDTSAQLTGFLLNILIQAPGSRKQESEADYLGLLMMARSCYNPEEAVRLWQRMSAYEQAVERAGQGRAPPQFMSTHPSSANRVEKIRAWLPEALAQSEVSECAQMNIYSNAFQNAWQNQSRGEFLDGDQRYS